MNLTVKQLRAENVDNIVDEIRKDIVSQGCFSQVIPACNLDNWNVALQKFIDTGFDVDVTALPNTRPLYGEWAGMAYRVIVEFPIEHEAPTPDE